MRSRKFFRYLWNFNAMSLALASVLGIVLLLFGVFFLVSDMFRPRHQTNVVNIDEEIDKSETLELGGLERVQGSDSVIVPLFTVQETYGPSSSGPSRSTRNLLFLDTTTEQSFWLLPTHDYLIADRYDLTGSGHRYDDEQDAIAIYYEVVKADSNGDNILDEEDDAVIALSKPDGTGYREILGDDQPDAILGHQVLSEGKLVVLYRKDGSVIAATFSLRDFAPLSTVEVRKIDLAS